MHTKKLVGETRRNHNAFPYLDPKPGLVRPNYLKDDLD